MINFIISKRILKHFEPKICALKTLQPIKNYLWKHINKCKALIINWEILLSFFPYLFHPPFLFYSVFVLFLLVVLAVTLFVSIFALFAFAMGTALFPCLVAFTVFLDAKSFLAVATFWMLIVYDFGIKCFWVPFHQNAPNLAPLLLVFNRVVARVALTRSSTWFSFPKTVAVKLKALGFSAIAYTFFGILFFGLRVLGIFRWRSFGFFKLEIGFWVSESIVISREFFRILVLIIIFLMIIVLRIALFRGWMAADGLVFLLLIKYEVSQRIIKLSLGDWVLVK